MDTTHNHFSEEVNNSTDNLPGSLSMNVSNDNNANLEANTSGINRNLFSEMALENNSNIPNDLEYLVSSSEETKEISSKTSFDSPPLTPNRNGDILFESTDDDETEIFAISCHPGESFGLVLGMNEIIDASEGEIRKVYVKKVSTNGAINRAMNESNNIRLGDEILAINGTYVKNLSRTECLNLLIDLPNEITLLLLRNKLPWTTGPRCSFYLNLVDKDPESILSPAPKLFTNEGKKIPDGYKLLEVSLYREDSDLLGISIVPSYGNTRHYYQVSYFLQNIFVFNLLERKIMN